MVQCQRCKSEFRWQWELERHLKRKKPCSATKIVVVNNKNVPIEPQDVPIEPQAVPIEPQDVPIEPQAEISTKCIKQENQCEYCKLIFSSSSSLNRHAKKCKMKDCEIRKLEMKTHTDFTPPPPNTCRFCKIKCSTSSHLSRHLKSCKEKDEYKNQLDIKYKQIIQNITNNTTNNIDNSTDNSTNINVTNNININPLGMECLDHLDMDKVISMIQHHKQLGIDEYNSLYMLCGKLVTEFHRMIREDPKNKNLIVEHERRQSAMLKRIGDDDYKKVEIEQALIEAFKNTSGKLYETMENIEEQQKQPFKKDTKDVHNRVKDLRDCGYTVGKWKEDDAVRRKFKMANVEKLPNKTL